MNSPQWTITAVVLVYFATTVHCKKELFVPEGDINVRAGPGTTFKVMFSLYGGETLVELERQADAVKVGRVTTPKCRSRRCLQMWSVFRNEDPCPSS